MLQELCQTLLYIDYNKGLTLVNPFLHGVDRAPTQKKNDPKRERLNGSVVSWCVNRIRNVRTGIYSFFRGWRAKALYGSSF